MGNSCPLGKQFVLTVFVYLFECSFFKSERQKYLEEYYYKRPKVIKFNKLMNSEDPQVLIKLRIFVNAIMKTFSY